MKVLLDTNVLIAAFIAHGVCSDLLEHCVRRHQLVTSEFILNEFRQHLVDKFKYSTAEVQEAIELLQLNVELVTPAALENPVCRDPDLEPILEAEGDLEKEYIEPLFPEILWAEDKQKCVNRFCEFRARLADDFMHETTELEWYIMMGLYQQWIEVYEDFKKRATTSKEKASIKRTLDLLEEIAENSDGDCVQVAFLFALYKERPAQFPYDYLDRLTDLMPRDVLQEYVQIRGERAKK